LLDAILKCADVAFFLSFSFRWLNTLGMLANQGIDVVIRHSFFDHGYNHLVDQNFNPLPVSAG
jgi:hypothetical protein